jgi:serine/threonine-protein kinase
VSSLRYCPQCGAAGNGGAFCALDGAQLRAPDPLGVVGHLAGNYRIIEHIGSGATGDVFRGLHPTLKAEVAIKVLAADIAKQQVSVDRFLQEAQAVNRVPHDGVVKIQDGGIVNERMYAVMELLHGSTLGDAMAETPQLAVGTACNVAADVLAVLAAAHTVGVVHRDVKPDNIFLTRNGQVKLLDFGIARLIDRTDRFTDVGTLVGTPSYMAPEQIRGQAVDARTDVYAVGVLLFALLTGQHPFDTSTAFVVLDGHLNQPAPSVQTLAPAVPSALAAIVATALAKQPAQRFGNANDMRRALLAVAATLPPVAFGHAGPTGAVTYQPWESHQLALGASLPPLAGAATIVDVRPAHLALQQPAGPTAPVHSAPRVQSLTLRRVAFGAGLVAILATVVAIVMSARSGRAPTPAAAVPHDAPMVQLDAGRAFDATLPRDASAGLAAPRPVAPRAKQRGSSNTNGVVDPFDSSTPAVCVALEAELVRIHECKRFEEAVDAIRESIVEIRIRSQVVETGYDGLGAICRSHMENFVAQFKRTGC